MAKRRKKSTPWLQIQFTTGRRRKRPLLRSVSFKTKNRVARRGKRKSLDARNLNLLLLALLLSFLLATSQTSHISLVMKIAMLLLISFYSFRFYNRYRKRQAILKSGIDKIDLMSGEEFERYLKVFFVAKGYKVERTPLAGDFGADLIISRDNVNTAIQAKRYSDKVGLSAIQEVVGAMAHYSCKAGMVITNNYFTPQAKKLADSNNITLWDRERLIQEILQLRPNKSEHEKHNEEGIV